MLDPGLTVDLTVRPDGETGTMSSHGVSWQVLALDGAVWLRGRPLWDATLPAERAAALGDGWVRVTDAGAAFASARFLPTFDRAVTDVIFGAHAPLAITGRTFVGGRPAVELKGGKDVYDIAATGTPYPLRWLDGDIPGAGGQPCGVTLDRFDEPVSLAPPSPVVATLSPTPQPSPSPGG